MRKIKRARPSAAIIVAVVSLVAALGCGAVAGVTISKLNKKEKTQVKRLSKRQAKKLDKRIELLPGPQGERGQQGLKGDPGPPGPENATTANGVRPVKVDYTAPTSGPEEVFLNEGGIEVRAFCSGAPSAQVQLSATAADGAITASVTESPIDMDRVAFETDGDFDPADDLFFSTAPTNPNLWLAFDYRGADGTTVTGTLQIKQSAAVASCLVSGTLFVG